MGGEADVTRELVMVAGSGLAAAYMCYMILACCASTPPNAMYILIK